MRAEERQGSKIELAFKQAKEERRAQEEQFIKAAQQLEDESEQYLDKLAL